ncbi:MAG: hypothetical protein KDB82_09725 [Planctomycetes bacterium]|nr:hypothetical protein [Planctomycetota bacterium]
MAHAEDIYLFTHAVLQQAAYQLSPPSIRARLHAIAIELLGALPEPPAPDLALHARLAQEGVTQFDDRLLKLERYWVERAGDAAEATYRPQDAIRFFQRLVEIQPAGSTAQVAALCRIVDLFMQQDRAADALPIAGQAVQLAARIDDPRLQATAYAALGAACRDGVRNAESGEHFERAVELFRQGGDNKGLAKALLGYAGSLWTQGELEPAMHAITEACEIAEGVDDVKVRSGAWMNRLGIVLQAQQFEQAEAALDKLNEVLDGNPDPALNMRHHAFRGYALDVLKRPAEARAEYQRTMELAGEIGNKAEIARCQTNLASLDAAEKRFAQARERHVAAERVARELGDLRIAAYACAGQSAIDEHLGDYNSALERSYAAIRIAEKLRMDVILPEWQIQAGLLHAELGDIGTARDTLTRFSSERHPVLEAARLSALAVIESRTGDPEEARRFAARAQDLWPGDAQVNDPLPKQWVERSRALLA